MNDLAHPVFVNPLVTFVNDQLACLLLVVAINSLENITWFKLEKQNIQAKKGYWALCSYTVVIHVVQNRNTGEDGANWNKTTKEITSIK